MIDGLKPYPEYKDSGVPWLGKVPKPWEIKPLKRWVIMNASVLSETTSPDHEFQYIDIGTVTTGSLRHEPQKLRFKAAPSRARRVIRAGDTIISTVRTYLKAIYFVTEDFSDFVCSTGFAVLTPRPGTIPKFVSYLAQSSAFTERVTAESVGIAYPAIPEGRLAGFELAVPSFDEQAAIVHFLDYADRRIRSCIRARQKLIKLLEEQKQAIIHRAVTRSLDPSVPLRPSGIPWLGNIPEHWGSAVKLKYISSLKGRLGWQGLKAGEYTRSGPYVVSSAHFKNQIITWDKCPHVTQKRYEMDVNIQLSESDILFMKDGAAMGKLAFVDRLPDRACLNSHVLLFRPLVAGRRKAYHPRYLFRFMLTAPFQNYVQVNGTGATFLGVSQWALGNYKICLPPIDEQHVIASFIDSETAGLERAMSTVEAQISLLREYRTRLVADVVTGKLDVRQASNELPEEIEEAAIPAQSEELTGEDEEETEAKLEEAAEEAEA